MPSPSWRGASHPDPQGEGQGEGGLHLESFNCRQALYTGIY